MWEILEVLRRVGRGENKSKVARTTGHSRTTVRRYIGTAVELGWARGVEEPSEELAAQVYAQHQPASERSPGETEARLLGHRAQIKEWLKPGPMKKRGLQLTKVHKLLRRRGVDVPYSTLHRFVVKYCDFSDRRRITVRRADCEPGELAEVDFGKLGLIPDPETGRRRTAWALLVTLGYSRHQYVHVTFSQKIPDVIEGLEDAWSFFGGCVRRVVVDNMKSAVTKADRYDPPTWALCKVHPDHHINFGKALYSVPTRYLRQQVWVRADSRLVRIYADGLLIKTHPRREPGGRATDYDDYPAELTPYALRDPQRIIRQAKTLDSDIGRFMEQLLSGTLPWTKIRQAQKLLRLSSKYGEHRVASACRRALAFELINVRRVESILLKDLDQLELPIATDAVVIPIETRFLRSAESFSHSPTQKEEPDS